MNNHIKCKKDYYLDGVLVFKSCVNYPFKDDYINGDRKIRGFKISVQDYKIWFYSGSEYFEIDYLT